VKYLNEDEVEVSSPTIIIEVNNDSL
jgi:hypothetical protein